MSRVISTLHNPLRLALGVALAAGGAVALPAAAQSAPAPSASTAQTKDSMDMSSMDMGSMDMGGMPMPASASSTEAPAAAGTTRSMKGDGMAGMDHGAMSGMQHPASPPAASSSSASSSMDSMDMGGMDMGKMPMPAGASRTPAAAEVGPAAKDGGMAGMKHGQMPDPAPAAEAPSTGTMNMGSMDMGGMQHGAMPGMDHADPAQGKHPSASSSMSGMSGMSGTSGDASGEGMSGMTMGAMQGGKAPPDARSPDYSDGVGYGGMPGMDMVPPKVGRLLLDNLEAVHGRDANGQAWELQGWYGGDTDKLWLRSEGERSAGRVEDGSAEVLWNHLIATYWSTQLGVRRDLGVGPGRTWAAFGVEGLAPYFFDVEATAYVGQSGRTAARFRATYDVLFTQRLILTPEFELNAYGKADPARRLGAGVSDASLGLRLRYEIRREFAPYVGVNWVRRFGATAGYARRDHQPVFDPQLVAGVRIWF